MTPTIEHIYWPGKVLIPYDYNMNIKNLRQISQIMYHGPLGIQPIYIDYDEECDDIYIQADIVYSVDAGNVMYIKYEEKDIFLYNITIREILQNLIRGNFDIYITWDENGLPDYVLDEFVFQAPLNQIDVYHIPLVSPMYIIPSKENIELVDCYEAGYEAGLNDAFYVIHTEFDKNMI